MADSPRDADARTGESTGVLDYLASAGVAAEGLAALLAFLGLGAVAAGHPLGRALLTAGLGAGLLGMVLVSGAGFRDSDLLDRDADSGRKE